MILIAVITDCKGKPTKYHFSNENTFLKIYNVLNMLNHEA